jgi:hypothetical protein
MVAAKSVSVQLLGSVSAATCASVLQVNNTGLEHVAIWATDGSQTVWANEPAVASFPAGIDDAGRGTDQALSQW